MAEYEAEMRLHDDRVSDAVDVLLLEAPDDWPPLQRAALTLALVWDVADLIAHAAELSTVDVLPAPLLWQASRADHICASPRVPVPGADLLEWTKIDSAIPGAACQRPWRGRRRRDRGRRGWRSHGCR
jgi:hypothetical protein